MYVLFYQQYGAAADAVRHNSGRKRRITALVGSFRSSYWTYAFAFGLTYKVYWQYDAATDAVRQNTGQRRRIKGLVSSSYWTYTFGSTIYHVENCKPWSLQYNFHCYNLLIIHFLRNWWIRDHLTMLNLERILVTTNLGKVSVSARRAYASFKWNETSCVEEWASSVSILYPSQMLCGNFLQFCKTLSSVITSFVGKLPDWLRMSLYIVKLQNAI